MHAASKGHAGGADAPLNGTQWIEFGGVLAENTGIAVGGL